MEKDYKMIQIDMNKAKNIWRSKLRQERQPKLELLDLAYIKALESNDIDLQKQITKKKQLLRDVTIDSRIDECQTPEMLKSLDLISEII